ncbi:MAG: S4 domain-containing protein, partial [Solirubrobacterales bacterium]
ALTSPYKFYQFWMNADDRDVETYLKLFSRREKDGPDGITALMGMHARHPSERQGQSYLASELTERVHGKAAMESVVAATSILFSEWDPHLAQPGAFDVLAQEIPAATVPRDGLLLIDALVTAGLAKSKGDARRQIEQGGVYLNQRRATDPAQTLGEGDWLAGGNLLLRKGKKDYALLRAAEA